MTDSSDSDSELLKPALALDEPTLSSSSNNLNTINHMEAINIWDDQDPDLLLAINASLQDDSLNSRSTSTCTTSGNVEEILQRFISDNLETAGDINHIIILRKSILQSTLAAIQRKSFTFHNPIAVSFSGEDAVDVGGPKREFFRLLMVSLKETGVFEGGWFSHDLSLLNNNKYYQVGKLIAWSVLQTGTGPKCLSKEAFCILQDIPVENKAAIKKIHVSNQELKKAINDLERCSEDEFQSTVNEHADTVADYGYSDVYTCRYSQKEEMIKCLLKQVFVFGVFAEINQFKKGMNEIGSFGDIVLSKTKVFDEILSDEVDELTLQSFKKLYKVCYSEVGSNSREREEQTMYSFELFLQDLSEGEIPGLSLSDLLIFLTGADRIPPLGFSGPLSLEFYDNDDGEKRLPWSSTCALTLHLPRQYNQPEELKLLLSQCLQESQGFGKC